jgi:hypothetical protein
VRVRVRVKVRPNPGNAGENMQYGDTYAQVTSCVNKKLNF